MGIDLSKEVPILLLEMLYTLHKSIIHLIKLQYDKFIEQQRKAGKKTYSNLSRSRLMLPY